MKSITKQEFFEEHLNPYLVSRNRFTIENPSKEKVYEDYCAFLEKCNKDQKVETHAILFGLFQNEKRHLFTFSSGEADPFITYLENVVEKAYERHSGGIHRLVVLKRQGLFGLRGQSPQRSASTGSSEELHSFRSSTMGNGC